MFALNFAFKDNLSKPAYFFMKQLEFRVGASSDCDLKIDDLKSLGFDIKVKRGIGRQIKISPLGDNTKSDIARLFNGSFDSEAEIDISTLNLKIMALDLDCYPSKNKSLSLQSSSIYRKVISKNTDNFPALCINDSSKRDLEKSLITVSLNNFSELTLGRSQDATVQITKDDISGTHAKIEFSNNTFYLTDLDSTNGTYLNSKPVNQRTEFKPKDFIALGASTVLRIVKDEEELLEFSSGINSQKALPKLRRYPAVLSNSELVQPRRMVLPLNKNIKVGRDPECDMWIGIPSVSREHCSITLEPNKSITIKDSSRNGTFTSSMNLIDGLEHTINEVPEVIFFDNSIFLIICFNEKQEEIYRKCGENIKLFLSHFSGNAKKSLENKELMKSLKASEGKSDKTKNYILTFAIIGFLCVLVIIGSLVWSLFL